MNERIRELAKEAELFSVSTTKFVEDGGITTYDVFKEKFAELIVQECIRVVDKLPPGYKDYRDQIEDVFRRDCIATMREHFGVE